MTEIVDSTNQHCDTCVCNSPHSMEHFNRCCGRLSGPVFAAAVKAGLSSPIQQRLLLKWGASGIHFTGWKLGQHSPYMAGQLLLGIDDPSGPRFFYLTLGAPAWTADRQLATDPELYPKPVEYNRGDSFDITGSPSFSGRRKTVWGKGSDIEYMIDWPDETLQAYFRLHADALVAKIAESVSG